MKKSFIILFVVSILFGCNSRTNQSQDENGAEETVSKTETVEMPSDISAQTKANIEKWKRNISKEYPSKRLSANDFEKYNLSKLWTTSFSLGYIGTNFQRMYITFEEINKISATEYSVKGFSQVKSNVCRFTGKIKNIEYNQLKTFVDDCNDVYENIANQGFLFGDFVIDEDETQKGTGIFFGSLMTKWLVTHDGELELSDLNDCGDSVYNNQFLGEWVSYKTKASKPVAWGEGEIPLARGVLYQGDGDICISAKYYNNGWEEFKACDPEYFR